MLDKIGSTFKDTLSKITKSLFVDEKLVNELIKEIQRSLLVSDVNVKLVFDFTNRIKERFLKEDTPAGLSKKEYLIKIVYEELTKFLGDKAYEIEVTKKPFNIMLVGLFGNGKTTTAAKLGKYFQKRGHKVALLSTDTWRPAAFKQLQQLGKQLNMPVFGSTEEKDPVKIYNSFKGTLRDFDVVVIDTAGRDALNKELVEELKQINKSVHANETLLVLAADVGQAAQRQAETFHDTCNVTGVIVTKMDGTAKGGGALSACSVTKAPVKYIGVGEKLDDFEAYNPERFVGRILGMGDLESLLEKAKEAITEEEAQDLGEKFLKGKFNLIDLYQQMEAMSKMGPLGKVMEMIPGFGQLKLPKDMIRVQESKLKVWRHIMDSCTKDELEDPETLDSSRIERIAKGAGVPVSDVRELIKQYRQSKKMLKMFKGGGEKNMEKMLKRFQGKLPM